MTSQDHHHAISRYPTSPEQAAQILDRHFGRGQWRGWDVTHVYAPSLVDGAAANVQELRDACNVLGRRWWDGERVHNEKF